MKSGVLEENDANAKALKKAAREKYLAYRIITIRDNYPVVNEVERISSSDLAAAVGSWSSCVSIQSILDKHTTKTLLLEYPTFCKERNPQSHNEECLDEELKHEPKRQRKE